jgi:hypothetical protein
MSTSTVVAGAANVKAPVVVLPALPPSASAAHSTILDRVRNFDDGSVIFLPEVRPSDLSYARKEYKSDGAMRGLYNAVQKMVDEKRAKHPNNNNDTFFHLAVLVYSCMKVKTAYFPVIVCSSKCMDKLTQDCRDTNKVFDYTAITGHLRYMLNGHVMPGLSKTTDVVVEIDPKKHCASPIKSEQWGAAATAGECIVTPVSDKPYLEMELSTTPFVFWHHTSWVPQLLAISADSKSASTAMTKMFNPLPYLDTSASFDRFWFNDCKNVYLVPSGTMTNSIQIVDLSKDLWVPTDCAQQFMRSTATAKTSSLKRKPASSPPAKETDAEAATPPKRARKEVKISPDTTVVPGTTRASKTNAHELDAKHVEAGKASVTPGNPEKQNTPPASASVTTATTTAAPPTRTTTKPVQVATAAPKSQDPPATVDLPLSSFLQATDTRKTAAKTKPVVNGTVHKPNPAAESVAPKSDPPKVATSSTVPPPPPPPPAAVAAVPPPVIAQASVPPPPPPPPTATIASLLEKSSNDALQRLQDCLKTPSTAKLNMENEIVRMGGQVFKWAASFLTEVLKENKIEHVSDMKPSHVKAVDYLFKSLNGVSLPQSNTRQADAVMRALLMEFEGVPPLPPPPR